MDTKTGPARAPSVLLLDDGELDDVHEVLLTLTDDVVRMRGGSIPARVDPPRHLFVASSRRAVVAGNWAVPADGPVRVAVVTDDSNTLRSMLRRIGFDMLVRRPFHPYALRLLCLRALYSGDERRRESRAPIGAEVFFRQGLRRRSAILADLSLRGCRLLSKRSLPVGSRVTLQPGKALVGAKAVPIRAKVVRVTPVTRDDGSDQWSVGLLFEDMSLDAKRQVHRVLQGSRDLAVLSREAAKAHGAKTKRDLRKKPSASPQPVQQPTPTPAPEAHEPAEQVIDYDFHDEDATDDGNPFIHEPNLLYAEGFVDSAAETSAEGEAANLDDAPTPSAPLEDAADFADEGDTEPPDAGGEEVEPPVAAEGAVEPPVAAEGAVEDDDDPPTIPDQLDEDDLDSDVAQVLPLAGQGLPEDRRKEQRARYEAKITELGERADRVLVGRDISAGGMRVDPQPDLMPGMCLTIAVYGDAREEPYVLKAEVVRNDGPEGVALKFVDVPASVGQRLENLVLSLPGVESLQNGEADNIGTVISEILEGDLFDPIT
ncbi:MAG: hypothetical protein HKP27_09005 [Myxococcales bacterium]|nr:hypothetical protein [Myxococcales bacterium]